MIKTVDFISSSRMEAMQGDKHLAVISITDPDSSDTKISNEFGPVLRLKFDDLDADNLAAGSIGKVFARSDAEKIASFLDMVDRETNLQGVIINCEMGRSRSGAIAWFALSYGGVMANERRIDGFNPLVLEALESVRARRLLRPSGMLVPAGFKL
ncbi:MAG: hypothetical protein FD131_3287 [Rhodocyclaceae bacterium]|nr:MAG: hypothetical protein FD131_3287 [Rhodocyclaceae bacterium]